MNINLLHHVMFFSAQFQHRSIVINQDLVVYLVPNEWFGRSTIYSWDKVLKDHKNMKLMWYLKTKDLLSNTYNLFHICDAITSNYCSEYTLALLNGWRCSIQRFKAWIIWMKNREWCGSLGFFLNETFLIIFDLLPYKDYRKVFIGKNSKDVRYQ